MKTGLAANQPATGPCPAVARRLEIVRQWRELVQSGWQALTEVKASGLPVGVCVTPLLPLENPEAFVRRLEAFRPDVLVTQDFHDSHGGFGADTGAAARQLLAARHWTAADYAHWVERLRKRLVVYEGESGFFPPRLPP